MKALILTEEVAEKIKEALKKWSNEAHETAEGWEEEVAIEAELKAALSLLTPQEVPEDAVEVINVLEGIFNVEPDLKPKAHQTALALIAAYARQVPRAIEWGMLQDMFMQYSTYSMLGVSPKEFREQIDAIASERGYSIRG